RATATATDASRDDAVAVALMRSRHIGAAIHVDCLPGDEAAVGAAEKAHHRRDLLGAAEPPEQRWECRVGRGNVAAPGVDETRHDAICRDAGGGKFAREPLGEPDEPRLAGGDMHAVGSADMAGHAADADD